MCTDNVDPDEMPQNDARKFCLQWFANNKGADQPTHPEFDQCFCYRLLEHIIYDKFTLFQYFGQRKTFIFHREQC